MTRLCIWGDSIAYGHSDKQGGWVHYLKQHCYENYENLRVYNIGISGDNTNKLLKRFEVECQAREPDIILFAIGINDSQYIHSRDNPALAITNSVQI